MHLHFPGGIQRVNFAGFRFLPCPHSSGTHLLYLLHHVKLLVITERCRSGTCSALPLISVHYSLFSLCDVRTHRACTLNSRSTSPYTCAVACTLRHTLLALTNTFSYMSSFTCNRIILPVVLYSIKALKHGSWTHNLGEFAKRCAR